MTPTRKGSFLVFNLVGIDVHLHWSWFLVAFYQISTRPDAYSTPLWKVAEYLSLFLIVLMHEFGHALACRQVGGTADQIVLWPLGGVAYVNSPQRPGATLWSIAAGPLVNVALVPVFLGLVWLDHANGWITHLPDLHRFLRQLAFINTGLLIFNLMPVYPLDGGQILRSLLWYPFGRARSLMIATIIGFAGGLGLLGWLVLSQGPDDSFSDLLWPLALLAFLLMNCWSGFKHARDLQKIAELLRHDGFNCPSCHASPPAGAYWGCAQCGKPFDIFAGGGTCPHCNAAHDMATCVDCGSRNPLENWKNPKL
jgi:Zn-dependent protease